MDISLRGPLSEQGHFGTRTFRHGYISVPWKFWLQHLNIMAQQYFGHGCFSICTFWHFAKQHRHFSTGALVPNVHVPKYPCAKMSQCHNIYVPKCQWCQNYPMPKCSCAEMSSCQKVPVMKYLFLCLYISIQYKVRFD